MENYRDIEYVNRPALLRAVRHGDIIRPLPGMRARGFVDLVDYWQACVEAAALPVPERLPRFREIDEGVAGLSFLHAMVKMYGPGKVARTVELDLLVRAHLDLARTALAVERYRLATGDVPRQLEELVPRYLERVPIDLFDGRPIRYRRTQPGYVLYCVLQDGHDNGGRGRGDVRDGEPCDWPLIVTR